MTKKLCGIYCIENTLDHRKYIGLSRDIHRRWSEHKSELNRNCHKNPYLQHAWNKYGSDAFNFYVVELCNEKELSKKECYYIKYFNTLSHEEGYNLTAGGENVSTGRRVIYLKTKYIFNTVKEAANYADICSITMIVWCKNKHNYMYLDDYNKLSDDEKNYWINYNWEIHNHLKLSKAHSRENLSEKTLKKYSKSSSGKNNHYAKKIYSPELDEIFDCAKDAYKKYGINRSSISSCINGKLAHAGKHPITGEKLTWKRI